MTKAELIKTLHEIEQKFQNADVQISKINDFFNTFLVDAEDLIINKKS